MDSAAVDTSGSVWKMPNGFIGNAAVGDVIQSMAPGVIQSESQARGHAPLKADGESVVIGVTRRKILRHGAERWIGSGRRQTGKTVRAERRRAISIQTEIAYRDVTAMHARVIDAQ